MPRTSSHSKAHPQGRGGAGMRPVMLRSGDSHTYRHADGKDAPFVDPLFHFGEPAVAYQLIEFLLCAPAHYPGFAVTMAGERARDELQLRMPRLAGVNQV